MRYSDFGHQENNTPNKALLCTRHKWRVHRTLTFCMADKRNYNGLATAKCAKNYGKKSALCRPHAMSSIFTRTRDTYIATNRGLTARNMRFMAYFSIFLAYRPQNLINFCHVFVKKCHVILFARPYGRPPYLGQKDRTLSQFYNRSPAP